MIDLGDQAPANAFLRPEDVPTERVYPLVLYRCAHCSLSQLRHVVDREVLFGKYVYLSSTSGALRDHYASLARDLIRDLRLGPGDVVVDIGANDGVLLREFPDTLVRIGVEPSPVGELARKEGLEIVRAFFDDDTAREILARYGRPAVVTATNVFPHVDRIDEFTRAIVRLLGTDGLFVIEASYLPDLVDGCLFDTIYHEHLSYLSVTAVAPFVEAAGLRVVRAERIPLGASGPAVRILMRPAASARPDATVAQAIARERAWGISDEATYARFAERVRSVRVRLRSMLGTIGEQGWRVAGYGAPAKGNTLLGYVGLTARELPFIADTNTLKQGLLTPGTHIPVVSEERLLEVMPECCLLLSWNYLEYFLRNSAYVARGGRFLVPLPEPTLAPEADPSTGSSRSSGRRRIVSDSKS